MESAQQYDADYYERGVEKRLSGYTNYHWRPEYVLPLANLVKERFGTQSVLDYGCAKGYLVKALRLLEIWAWGYDISKYAIENCEPSVREWVTNDLSSHRFHSKFTTVISKDVLEHVAEEDLAAVLATIRGLCDRNFMVVVPLGDDGVYRIREYELDATHRIRRDEVWWMEQFSAAGFRNEAFYYSLPGVKDHWTERFPMGNGIFMLRIR